MSFQWTIKRRRAAQLVADGRLSHTEIAQQVGISESCLTSWKANAEFALGVESNVEAVRQRLRTQSIQTKQVRLERVSDLFERMWNLIEARSGDMNDEVAGGSTGLLAREVRSVGEELHYQYKFDAALTREIRETMKQMAIELGEWTEKRELSGKIDVTRLSDDELKALIEAQG